MDDFYSLDIDEPGDLKKLEPKLNSRNFPWEECILFIALILRVHSMKDWKQIFRGLKIFMAST